MQQQELTQITANDAVTMISIEQGIALNAALKSHDFSYAQNPETMDKDHRAFIAGYQSADAGDLKGRAKICYNAGQQLRQSEIRKAQAEKRERNTAKQKRHAANKAARAQANRQAQLAKSKGK